MTVDLYRLSEPVYNRQREGTNRFSCCPTLKKAGKGIVCNFG